nr:hypothetical protein HK105_006975 [Polyrhizophydium stewartii]
MRVTSSRRSRRAGRSAARRAVSAILTRSQAKANPEKAKRMMKAVTDKAQAAEDKRRADRSVASRLGWQTRRAKAEQQQQEHLQQQEHQHQQDQHQQQDQQQQQDHQSSPARFGQRHMLREAQKDSASLMAAYVPNEPQLVDGLAYMEVDGAPGPADLASHEKRATPQKTATLRKQKRVYKYREYPRDKGAAQNMQISGDAISKPLKDALSQPLRAVHTLGRNDFLEYERRLFAILQLQDANGNEDIIRTIKEIMKLSTDMHLDFADTHGITNMMNHYVSIISKLPEGDSWKSSAAGIPSTASSQAAHAPAEAFKECYCMPAVGKRCRCKLDDEVLEDHPVPLTNEEANEQEKAVSEIAKTYLYDAWDAVNRTPVDNLQSCSDGKLRGVMLLAQKLANQILDLCGIAEGSKEHCRAMRMLEASLLLKYNDPKVQVKHALFSSLSGVLGLTDCPNKDCFGNRKFEDILARETSGSFKIKSEDPNWLSHAVRSFCRIPYCPKADQGAAYSAEERRAIRKAFKPKDSTLHAIMCRAGSACKYAGANSK